MPERFLDVSHEALIRGWPRLRRWLDEDRAGLRVQRRITETAEEWQRSNRDQDLLYRGARLIQAQEWRARHEAELNPLEREFLDASIVLKQRVEEEKRLHEAESERVKLLLEKRKRTLIFGATVFVLGIIILIAFAALFLVAYRAWWLSKRKAADLETQRQTLVEQGQSLRENTKSILSNGTDDPLKDVTALRNLSLALNLNRQDTEAAKMARDLLLQRVWCPPVAPELRFQQDALLAATFSAGGTNNEVFAAAGNGQLLFWNGRKLSPVQSLFEKPKPANPQQIVQPGFASFSPDGRWLLIIPPTLASAAGGESAVQGASAGHELCRIQIWRWSIQNRTYEPTGEDLEIQRLRGSRINFVWSNESDQLVLVNARGTNEAECAYFEVEGNTIRELVDRSKQLTEMKIVALAFAAYRTGIAAVSVDSEARALRKVTLFSFNEDYAQVFPVNGKDSILLAEGFLPDGIAFGPGNDEITLTSWNSVRTLDLRDGKVTRIPPPTFRDQSQSMRVVIGPGNPATRLVATSLYGRVNVAKSAHRQEPVEPVVFSGSTGIPQFSLDGQRLLILSGGVGNAFDTMRLIDVSPLYRAREAAPENFEEKPAPPWLAEIASAVSALDTGGDGSLITLEAVRKKYPESKAGDAYESVWKRFFPDEKSNSRLETGR
jgi:hypothetical protein